MRILSLWFRAAFQPIVMLLVLSLLTACPAQGNAATVYRQAGNTVVLIEGQKGFGSGVIIQGECGPPAKCSGEWVLTNYHVVSGEQSVTVRFANGKEVQSAEIIAADPEMDLVLTC